jgi:transmembrane 9 superfamily protein 2/4
VRTALVFPGFVSAIFLTLNFLVWGQRSSGAVPFGTLCALVFLWCGISVPLCFVGSYFGYKKPAPEVRVGQRRQSAVQSGTCGWFVKTAPSLLPRASAHHLGFCSCLPLQHPLILH